LTAGDQAAAGGSMVRPAQASTQAPSMNIWRWRPSIGSRGVAEV
jgi:hypothetical protein